MLEIIPYTKEHGAVFDRLNRAWIEEFFTIEPFDDLVLTQPEKYIIEPGGEIWSAALDGHIVGSCALLAFADGVFEFSKLGVDANARGQGIARALLRHCKQRAKARGAHTLKIFTSRRLQPANRLYISEGFVEVAMTPAQKTRYQRADVMYDFALTV
jgi:GNAT superfamily N-acetyltransferase